MPPGTPSPAPPPPDPKPGGLTRSSLDRQVGVTDFPAVSQRPEEPAPPFQFTLRQLLWAMTAICVAAASFYWFSEVPALIAIVLFVAIAVWFFVASFPRYSYSQVLATIALGGVILCLLLPVFQGARVNYRWASCQNTMHNLALALQQYESTYGTFPPAYIANENGKPMHSWRVLLLPYLDQLQIYRQYRFDEPWNGPNNSQLHGELVRLFECPSDSHFTRTDTSYLAVTGSQTMWPGATSTKMSDIKDGPTNTILLVEVHNSGIHWMEPRDLDVAQMPMTVNSPTGLSISSGHYHHTPFANIVFVDGHHQPIPNTTPAKALRAALTISGGEKDRLPTVRLPR